LVLAQLGAHPDSAPGRGGVRRTSRSALPAEAAQKSFRTARSAPVPGAAASDCSTGAGDWFLRGHCNRPRCRWSFGHSRAPAEFGAVSGDATQLVSPVVTAGAGNGKIGKRHRTNLPASHEVFMLTVANFSRPRRPAKKYRPAAGKALRQLIWYWLFSSAD